VSPHKTKEGGELPPPATPPRVGPKTLANPQPTGVGKGGGGGASPLPGGLGDVPPKTKIGGEQPTLATPPRVGPKTLANPQPTGVGNGGWRGRKPPWRGAWGVSPHKTKEGGELPPPATPPRVGPKTLANPQPTGVGKRGVEGAQAPWRGAWGVSPHKTKEGGELPPPATPPRVGPKTLANPQPTGVGNGGSRGAKPPWRGAWGVSPHKTKEGGELPPPATPPRVGPKTLANPQPTGVGKRGWRGRSPLPGGLGDVPPKTKIGGEQPTLATPPRVGPKPLANPQPTGVG
jgi:hypothetical protein